MQKGTISVQTENIFPIIKKFLYSDQEIFLRELISNAVDATTKLKVLSSKGEVKGELGDTKIEIILDKEKKQLIISDKGIGMTEDEVNKYLNQVAFSSATEFIEKFKAESSIIGHFGLGFYSAFMVSSKVDVITKSFKEGSEAVKWSCDGDPEYTIEPAEKEGRGTDIILHIAEDALEYLEDSKINELLDKYCKFLPVEIQFGTKKETIKEGEGDDAKDVEIELPNIINNPAPAWKKLPSDLTDEDYRNFYSEINPYSQPPLFWIHLNIDFPFNLTGILYFPKLNNSFENQKNKIHLYSNQVFVTDDVKEIIPEFLTLLHGVIDSPDIPLNVSRSYLQSDREVKKITSYITKKVADKLAEIFKNERAEYETKWSDIGPFVKYGMITDEKFSEKAMEFVLLKNVTNQFFTINEYKEKVKATQTDKHGKTVLIYTNKNDNQISLIKSAQAKGYDVIEFDTIFDNHFNQHLEYKDNSMVFVRIDSDTIENLVQKDEKIESVLSEKEVNTVKSIFEGMITEKMNTVIVKAMNPDDRPVQIVRPEFMRRMKEMQQLQGNNMFGDMPESMNIIVNSNHPLITNKLMKTKDKDKKADVAKHLYDLALLNHGMLKGEALDNFVNKSLEMMN